MSSPCRVDWRRILPVAVPAAVRVPSPRVPPAHRVRPLRHGHHDAPRRTHASFRTPQVDAQPRGRVGGRRDVHAPGARIAPYEHVAFGVELQQTVATEPVGCGAVADGHDGDAVSPPAGAVHPREVQIRLGCHRLAGRPQQTARARRRSGAARRAGRQPHPRERPPRHHTRRPPVGLGGQRVATPGDSQRDRRQVDVDAVTLPHLVRSRLEETLS